MSVITRISSTAWPRTKSTTAWARSCGGTMASKEEARLKYLQKLPTNRQCFVCSSLGSSYVVPSAGVFICMDCSGICMKCGLRVKSVSMGKFSAQEVKQLEEGGNEVAGRKYLAKWKNEGDAARPVDKKASKVEAWIQSVLVDKRYYSDTAVASNSIASPGSEKGAIPVKPLSDVLAGSQNVKLTVTPTATSNGGAASSVMGGSSQSASTFDPFSEASNSRAHSNSGAAAAGPTGGSMSSASTAVPAASAFDPFGDASSPFGGPAFTAAAPSKPAVALPAAAASPFDPFGDSVSSFPSAGASSGGINGTLSSSAGHTPALAPPPPAPQSRLAVSAGGATQTASVKPAASEGFGDFTDAPAFPQATPVPSQLSSITVPPPPGVATATTGTTFDPFAEAPAFPAPATPAPSAAPPAAQAASPPGAGVTVEATQAPSTEWSAFEDAPRPEAVAPAPAAATSPTPAHSAPAAPQTTPAAAADPFGQAAAFPSAPSAWAPGQASNSGSAAPGTHHQHVSPAASGPAALGGPASAGPTGASSVSGSGAPRLSELSGGGSSKTLTAREELPSDLFSMEAPAPPKPPHMHPPAHPQGYGMAHPHGPQPIPQQHDQHQQPQPYQQQPAYDAMANGFAAPYGQPGHAAMHAPANGFGAVHAGNAYGMPPAQHGLPGQQGIPGAAGHQVQQQSWSMPAQGFQQPPHHMQVPAHMAPTPLLQPASTGSVSSAAMSGNPFGDFTGAPSDSGHLSSYGGLTGAGGSMGGLAASMAPANHAHHQVPAGYGFPGSGPAAVPQPVAASSTAPPSALDQAFADLVLGDFSKR